MTNEADDALALFYKVIKKRVLEQLYRHAKINPTGDPRKVVDIQMKQERERLERLIEQYAGPMF